MRMWRRITALTAVLGVVGLGWAVTSGGAAASHARRGGAGRTAAISAARYSVQIEAVFDRAGNPELVANFRPNGSLATAHWSICAAPPRSTCVAAHTDRGALSPGARPRGTLFRATAHYRSGTYVAQVRWRGRVTARSRARLVGRPRIGARVRSVAAVWSGGWGTEIDQLGVEACRTKSAHNCVMVSGGELGCPDHSHAVVDRAIEGRYLFALDARLPNDEPCAGVAYRSESDIPVWAVGRTVARSAPSGPVTG